MTKDRPDLPPELPASVSLLANPLAGMAAMSALGFGFASHAVGLWAGAVSGAVATSRQLFSLNPDEKAGTGDFLSPSPPSERAKAAADNLVADARNVIAQRIATPPQAKASAGASGATARTMAGADPAAAKIVAAAPRAQKPAASSAPNDPGRPRAIERPESPDDLKAISGIGPKLETVLNGFGLWTYGQIAGMKPAEIAWLDDRLGFRGRIERDDWVGQATTLACMDAKPSGGVES